MGAISALSDAGDALGRNPVLFAGALVLGVAGAAVRATPPIDGPVPYPGLLVLAGFVLVEPFLAGGLLGMADEALSGSTSLGALWRHGAGNYLHLLVARVVVGVVAAVVVGAVLVGGFYLGTAAVPESGQVPAGMHNPMAGFVELLVSAFIVAVVVGPLVVAGHVLLQFYPAGVVLADEGALGSFRYSLRLVRDHPLSVLGYTLAAFVGGAVLAVVTGFFAGPFGGDGPTSLLVVPTGTGSLRFAAGVVLAGSVARTVRIGLLRTYYVAFVRSLEE